MPNDTVPSPPPAAAIDTPSAAFARGRAIFDGLAEELYFGFNMRSVLAQASPEEQATLRAIVARARKARGAR